MDDRQLLTLVALHAFLVSGRPIDNAVEAAILTAEQFEKAVRLRNVEQEEPEDDDDDDDDDEPETE